MGQKKRPEYTASLRDSKKGSELFQLTVSCFAAEGLLKDVGVDSELLADLAGEIRVQVALSLLAAHRTPGQASYMNMYMRVCIYRHIHLCICIHIHTYSVPHLKLSKERPGGLTDPLKATRGQVQDRCQDFARTTPRSLGATLRQLQGNF